ncbi:MAG: conjugal transfer protein TraX [Ruminococcus sp.]|nr:conjugal transfer protein TraX [Ruminococcus sp.]
MEKTKIKGITASDLKYIAVLAMFIDHTAYLFVPSDSQLYILMRFIGRITAPIMCFFISEGYHYTRNIKKYFIRMAVFAFVSHFAFAFCFGGGFFEKSKESMITTLFLCLLSVHVVNSEKINNAFKFPLVIIIAWASQSCDWGHEAICYTLAFEFARNKRKNQIIAFSGTAFVFKAVPLLKQILDDISYFPLSWHRLGVFLTVPLLLWYNGEKGGGKYTKWVFYVFYPAHLLILGYINNRWG